MGVASWEKAAVSQGYQTLGPYCFSLPFVNFVRQQTEQKAPQTERDDPW